MRPHPEGGFYREIFRSSSQVAPADERGTRAALTTIYFLLPQAR
jgi:predicted cupin superfamily sugar epimerase